MLGGFNGAGRGLGATWIGKIVQQAEAEGRGAELQKNALAADVAAGRTTLESAKASYQRYVGGGGSTPSGSTQVAPDRRRKSLLIGGAVIGVAALAVGAYFVFAK